MTPPTAPSNFPPAPDSRSDRDLLLHFAEARSDAAFAELVNRHLGFVYATALRRLAGDAHLAKDVAQLVFTDLARRPRRAAEAEVLPGWLYAATCFAAAKVVRGEQRRRARETQAAAMNSSLHESARDAEWAEVRPVIDDALSSLKEADRHAILLRFFQARTFGEIAAQLKLTENAARMRVDRALDQLRAKLSKHGIASSATALAAVLTANAGVTVPTGVSASITSAALAASAGSTATAWALTGTAMKLQAAAASVALIAGVVGIQWEKHQQAELRAAQVVSEHADHRQRSLRDENQRLQSSLAALRTSTPTQETITAERDQMIALIGAAAHANASAPPTFKRSAPVDASKPFDLRELDSTPVATQQNRPKYPADLRAALVPAEAVVEFVVGADGRVRDITFKSSTHASLEQPIREALGAWQFRPGKKAGQAVATRMVVPFVFQMNQDDPRWF